MRVALAEDHALLREGMRRLLTGNGFSVAHAVGDESTLIEALDDPTIELAILDVRLPPTGTDEGLRAAIGIRSARPGFPVMVISQYVEHLYARELLADDASGVGYLLKDRVGDVAEFLDGLNRIADGGTVLDPQVVSAIMGHRGQRLDRLTPRERDVLALMAEGHGNAAIASRLVVTEKAVAKHINNIFTKLDLGTDTDDHRRVSAVLTWLRA